MSKLLKVLIAAIAFPAMLEAQEPAKKANGCGCNFSSINQAGFLEGQSPMAFQLQTINGFKYKNWFAGIGLGLDRYRIRSVPLFFDLRWNLFNNPNTPFVYGDIGGHFPWVMDKDKSEWMTSNFKGGLYYDAGFGYRLGIGKNRGIVFSGGFSLKKMRETRYPRIWCEAPFCTQPAAVDPEVFNFKLRRFSFKAGIQL
ncbi:MAG TPA: hypothetical protein VD993_06135 [Chitinophagaceae bacterium]|nr:hypothetical protein [Chitinophagaceae bacterium]